MGSDFKTEAREEMKMIREMVTIQDTELKPKVRIIAFPGAENQGKN